MSPFGNFKKNPDRIRVGIFELGSTEPCAQVVEIQRLHHFSFPSCSPICSPVTASVPPFSASLTAPSASPCRPCERPWCVHKNSRRVHKRQTRHGGRVWCWCWLRCRSRVLSLPHGLRSCPCASCRCPPSWPGPRASWGRCSVLHAACSGHCRRFRSACRAFPLWSWLRRPVRAVPRGRLAGLVLGTDSPARPTRC